MRTLKAWQVALVIGTSGLASGVALAAGPASVLPPGSAVKGWKRIGAPKMYNARNLFDLIDGEAQSVLGYAFAGCAHAEYAPMKQAKPALTIDVYDMTDPLDAFGLFGSDRLSGKRVPIGAEGVAIGGSGLNFWKGRYVVRTTIFQVNPATKAALVAFAKAAAARIHGSSSVPPLVKALPPGMQPGSEGYVRSNVVGQSFLRNAVTARYPKLGQGAELFICTFASQSAAEAALGRYRAFERSGTGMAAVSGIGNGGFAVVDRYAKNVVVVRKGSRLIGVVRARTAAAAKALVKQAVARVK